MGPGSAPNPQYPPSMGVGVTIKTSPDETTYDRLVRAGEALANAHDTLDSWGGMPSGPSEGPGPMNLDGLARHLEQRAAELRDRISSLRASVGGTL